MNLLRLFSLLKRVKETLSNLKVTSPSTSCTEIMPANSNRDQLLLVIATYCESGANLKKRVEILVERRAEWRSEWVQSKSETIHTITWKVKSRAVMTMRQLLARSN